ncbi:hypothetical protein QFC20_001721 [Naganishia adeliensis]|uniref:Uncharacterized protein n=1 Tax=Naganishia adeliensis TaxID=92952 RepID=A0ACC2WR16_9TREE|nr:hypothetical protein QFC20_001721 [Naganishia adeliensis]
MPPHEHPSAIHHLEDLVPEIVASPDGMSDGTFPSGAQSPVKTRFEHSGIGEVQAGGGSPFPLQGPIVFSTLADGQDPSATEGHATKTETGIATGTAEETRDRDGDGEREKNAAKHLSGVRAAPASPSATPTISRRTSQTTIQINGKPVLPDPSTTTHAEPSASIARAPSLTIRSRDRSGSTSHGGTPPTSAGSGAGRTRRPSTLIPRPGKEGETIPPKYASASEDKEVQDGAAQNGDAAPDTQNEEERTTDMEQQSVEETRPSPPAPRVIVRDFGFIVTDPRYRGAFHPIPGEAEDEEEDDDDARSTASGGSSGWNRFTAGRRKSSSGGWSGFGFGGFGFGGLSRRFSKSSRRGSQAGLSGAGDDTESTRSGTGSRRSSVQVGVTDASTGKSPAPGGIILPPLPHDTDVSLSDLTPSSTADDEPPFGRQYVFGAGGGALLKRGASGSGSRLRALSGAGSEESTSIPEANRAATPDPDPRLSILSQVSEEAHSASDSSPSDEAAKWPSDSTSGAAASVSSSGTTVTAREPRGRYKVLYEFEAEGEHEMSVAEGEVLLVGGRWGNMGWVIAERVAAEGEAVVKGLVPEGYLGEKIADR